MTVDPPIPDGVPALPPSVPGPGEPAPPAAPALGSSGSLTGILGKEALDLLAERCRQLIEGVGGYRVIRCIGRGGEGAVFEGTAPDGTRVAVKVACPIRGAPDEVAEKFRSFKMIERLDHPAVVRARACVDSGNWCALVMEFVDGVELPTYLGSRADRITCVLGIGQVVAEALQHCHDRDVLHRDVKPQNIRVRPSGTPVLMDFGTAKDLRHSQFSDTPRVKGTLGFMAPEQFLPGSHIDGRADVFGLGMTLHLLITGRYRPAGPEGALEHVEGWCRDAIGREPGAANVDPAGLAHVLFRATDLDVARRLASAGEFAAILAALRSGRSGS